MRFRSSLRALALPAFRLLLAALAPMGAAVAQSGNCIELNGRQFCGEPAPQPWTVTACDEGGLFVFRWSSWCIVRGGTWNPDWTCTGATPDTEENIEARVLAFSIRVHDASCHVTGDTGYHATYWTANCGGNITDNYVNGQLQATHRLITMSCGENFTITKSRNFACAAGYTPVSVASYGTLCARALDPDCPNCGKGNPVAPGTGIKFEVQTDYRHPSGLEFTRYYHSMRFSEPYSTTAAHSENRLGKVWRSNFDKRVLPLTPQSSLTNLRYAITGPGSETQFFDLNGVEQWNYRGAAGTLVTVPGTGWYYKGPDSTEFYGTDGRLRTITQRSGLVLTLTYTDGTSGPGGGYALDDNLNPKITVLPAGLLLRVTDSYGNALSFGYDVFERIVKMTDPAGGVYKYVYDKITYNLLGVTFPDAKQIAYRYNEPANMNGASIDYALTSIVDENNALYASFTYDASGRALSTEHAGGAGREQLAYNPDGSASITDPLNTVRSFGYANTDGVKRFTGSSLQGGAGYGSGVKGQTFDAAGNTTSKTDFDNIKTCYAYLAGRNLETVRVEGVSAATDCSTLVPAGAALPAGSRKIVTEWHARWRAAARTSEPGRRTTFAYNGDTASCAPTDTLIDEGGTSQPIGVVCSKTVQATTDTADGSQGFDATVIGTPRTWTYTYDSRGRVLTSDGPRIDVADTTTYSYYADDDPDPAQRGNLATITNAAGHVTQITAYNAHGQPLTIVDSNGLTTTLIYDARRRLKSRSVGTEVTSYDYDNAGQLIKVTLPDGSYLGYSYDDAHRLTGLHDNLGNRIAYTLDAMGNRTQEQVFDPSNALAQTRSRVYNGLNQLFRELGAQNQTTEYAYDNRGNAVSVTDPLLHVTTNEYDALGRLMKVTSPAPVSAVTQYAYNGLDALIQVTDPRNLVTGYGVDGLGNLDQQTSPDTGTTINTYDDAGNLRTQTDAKSQLTAYSYDALNRVALITFHDGSKQAYAYDQGTNGIGRLSSITETDPADNVTSQITYGYDAHGRVIADTRVIGGVQYVTGYTYDDFGRLAGMSYPGGRTLTYTLDTLGRVAQIDTTKNNQTQTVVSSALYQPFGGPKSFAYGNGQVYTRSYDQDGRIATYNLGSQSYAIGYDAASRIEFISESGNPSNSNTYAYDVVDRLTSAVTPSTGYAYDYDAVGNRLSKTAGSGADTYAYSPTSNRLASITRAGGAVRSFVFDANGSTTDDGINTYAYDARGRMVQAMSTIGVTAYQVNALGQRVRKTSSLGDTVFHYDTRGHLILETDPGGRVKREIFYLGDMPVAVFQ